MFKEIYDNTFVVWTEKPDKFVVPVPNGDARLVAERIWEMLEWLHDEFIKEAKEHTRLEEDSFQIRNISRTLSYVNHVYLLEGILKKMYENMFVAMNTYGVTGITEDETSMTDRENEISTIFEFRHTVAAHTAYAYPDGRKDDALTAANSLHSFLGVGFDGKDMTSFTVNAGEIMSDGKTSKRKIPSINIRDSHVQMKSHFESWTIMFIDKLVEAHSQLPIKTEDYRVERAE